MKIVLAELKLPDLLIDSIRTSSQEYEGFNFLALGFLKSAIKNDSQTKAVDVEILERASLLHRLEMIKNEIISREPDLIGLSVYVWNYYRTLKLCELVKKEYPHARIVLGGPEVSFNSEEILSESPYVDGIVRGEGEITFKELVRSMLQKKPFGIGILGLTYRSNSKIISNPPRPLLDDLNEIPSPFLTGVLDMSNIPKLELETSRGCQYHCAYCVWCETHYKIRYFNEKRIIKELKLATEYGIENVVFYDAIFSLPKIVYNLCKRMKEEKIKIAFDAFLRPELVNEKMLNALEEAGMTSAEVGVQSFNPATLEFINRYANIEKVKECFELMRRRSISMICDLIIGLPGETFETMKEGIDFVTAFPTTTLRTFVLQVLPGSQLWRKYQEYGLEFIREPPHLILSTSTLRKEEIAELIQYGFTKTFDLIPTLLAKLIIQGTDISLRHSHSFDPILGG